MGKALNEVRSYAYEDVTSIHKHWIIFLKRIFRLLFFAVFLVVVYTLGKDYLIIACNFINGIIPSIPFLLKDYLLVIFIAFFALKAFIGLVTTFIEYLTVGLQINNIQIKGKSGLANVGMVNASLDQISNVRVNIPLIGRFFGYGDIYISAQGIDFCMSNMKGVLEFQDAVILLQEAQKEGRALRSDERRNVSIMNQTEAQIRAMGMIANTINQRLPGPDSGNQYVGVSNNSGYIPNNSVQYHPTNQVPVNGAAGQYQNPNNCYLQPSGYSQTVAENKAGSDSAIYDSTVDKRNN